MTEAILDFLKNLPEELIVFLISILPIIELRGAVPIGAIFGLPFYTNYALSVLGNILPIPFILLFIPKILDFLARFKIFRPMVEWLRKKANKHSSKVLGDEARPSTESIEASAAADSTAEAIAATAEAIDSTAEAQAVTEKAQAVTAEAVDTATEVAETSVEAVDTVGEESEITADTVEASTPSAPRAKTKRKMSKAIFIALLLFVALPAPGTGGWTGALIASLFDLPKKWSFLSIFLGVLLCGVIMCLASYGVLGFLSFLL